MTVDGGSKVVSGKSLIGVGSDINGAASITGAGSQWTTNSNLYVGYAGIGVLDVSDDALVSVGGNLSLASIGYSTGSGSSGTVNLNGGTLDLQGHDITQGGGTAALHFTEGTLKNVGSFGFDLHQQGGILAAGASPGAMAITGNYVLDSAGTLQVELAGPGGVAGSDFDFYSITGSATLSGMLEVLPDGGFRPTNGGHFDVLSAVSIDAGSLNLSSGYSYEILDNAGSQFLRITAVPEPASLALLEMGGLAWLGRRRRVQ
jgi:T5SS/PEP-CTERM-associated repeat protein